MPRIAVTGRIPNAGFELLHEAGDVVAWDSLDVPTVEQVHEMVAGADAVLTLLTTKVDDAFLDAAARHAAEAGGGASAAAKDESK